MKREGNKPETFEVTINIFGSDERNEVLKRIESELHGSRRWRFMHCWLILKEEYSITVRTDDKVEAYNAFLLFCTFKDKEVKMERRVDE